MISTVYAAAARYRRRHYAIHPSCGGTVAPVISIGNLAVGGRAKTPLTALVAARLRALGERPAILSRGYARRDAADGVVVVRDPDGIRADLDRAGDEPLMLARQLDGVAVLASSSRYLAGRLAEHHFGCTVHVLDDGFQHFDLHRDADILVIARADLERPGRCRPAVCASRSTRRRRPTRSCCWTTASQGGAARIVGPSGLARAPPAGRRRLADAAATPRDAFRGSGASRVARHRASAGVLPGSDARAGWTIARELPYRDHHRYTAADLARIVGAVRAAGRGALILTTEKDLVRLLPFRPFAVPVAYVPMTLEIDPAAAFDEWLARTIEERAARDANHEW